MKDFYWDIRPKPEYGTIEIRVCDTPLTVRRAAQFAAYAQALCAYHVAERPREPTRETYLVNSFNRFEAGRYGFRGEMVDPYAGVKRRIGDDILEALAMVESHARRLDAEEPLAALAAAVRADDSDASWRRPVRRGARRLRTLGAGALTHPMGGGRPAGGLRRGPLILHCGIYPGPGLF
jgi:carboxylate-amine ligase